MQSRRNLQKEKEKEQEKDEFTIQEIQEQQDNELKKCVNNNYVFFIRFLYYFFNYFINILFKVFKFIINVCGIYLLWICLHYFASHLYVKFCVPNNIMGFLMSPFMTATPHCQGLRWLIYNAANMINNMWIILGTWICSTVLIITHNRTTDPT